jgi:hypothetical protein
MGWSDIGAPTRRISMNSRRSRRRPRSVSWIAVRPEAMYQNRIALDAANDVTVAIPAPATPSGGSGPMPNIKSGTSTMCRASAVM